MARFRFTDFVFYRESVGYKPNPTDKKSWRHDGVSSLGNRVFRLERGIENELVDELGPVVGVEVFTGGFVESFVGVCSEEVALGLEEVGGEASTAVAVVVSQ